MTASPPDQHGTRGLWRRRRGPQSPLRRKLGNAARMIAALAIVGSVYTAFSPSAAAQGTPLSASAQRGQQIYESSCITCHGLNAQGVPGRGPSLAGVGGANVYFQVVTGRMPADGQGAQAEQKQPVFNEAQALDLAAYIQALGGGAAVPDGTDFRTGGDLALGGELFRTNCSSCHAFGGGGGALSSGKYAPSLAGATDKVIYTAMLAGPQSMPVFGDNQLTPDEKRDIIAYIQSLKSDQDPGGLGIGRIGPVSEGLVIFLVGIVGIVLLTVWIAGKS